MTLAEIKPGMCYRIISIPDEHIRNMALRFGIGEGATICCEHRLAKGPVIVSRYQQRMAIGYDLAQGIEVVIHLVGVAGHAAKEIFPGAMDRVGGKPQCR